MDNLNVFHGKFLVIYKHCVDLCCQNDIYWVIVVSNLFENIYTTICELIDFYFFFL